MAVRVGSSLASQLSCVFGYNLYTCYQYTCYQQCPAPPRALPEPTPTTLNEPESSLNPTATEPSSRHLL